MKNHPINPISIFLISTLALMAGCHGSSNSNAISDSEIRAEVTAAQGGVFSSQDGNVTIDIPAGALSEDIVLNVAPVDDVQASPGDLMSAGRAYDVNIGDATLNLKINIALNLDSVPTHPTLTEIATEDDGDLKSLPANFYRRSSNTVLAQTQQAGLVVPVFRTLQQDTSAGVARGQEIFLNESFGNEAFFNSIGLPAALNAITPTQAVQAGVQVDLTRVPQGIVDVLQGDDYAAKQAALGDPAVTRALLISGAVLGVTATGNDAGEVVSTGVTCALCHGTVETNGFEIAGPGEITTLPIGAPRLDGTPNTLVNVGAILALTAFATNAGQDTVDFLNGFGPGAFDARALPDNPLEDGVLNPTSIPALWNFVDLDNQGYAYNWDGLFTGENGLASRDEAVIDLALHANGAFGTSSGSLPPALSASPTAAFGAALIAAEDSAPGNDIPTQDLLDLQAWERSHTSPAPGDYDEALAETGFKLFYGTANCSGCHSTPEFTGPVVSSNVVFVAPQGGLAGGIKTPGLRGIASTAPYFHDSSATTLLDVMEVYSGRVGTPVLSQNDMNALVEYMKSL